MFSKPTLTGDYEFYWSGDPAFDSGADTFNHEAWMNTLDDKHLPRKEGQTPTRFVLRRFSDWERQMIFGVIRQTADDGNHDAVAQLMVRGAIRVICDAFGPGEDWTPGRTKVHEVSVVEDGVYTKLLTKEGMVGELVQFIQERDFSSPRD